VKIVDGEEAIDQAVKANNHEEYREEASWGIKCLCVSLSLGTQPGGIRTSSENGFPGTAPFGSLCLGFPFFFSVFGSLTGAAFFTPSTPPLDHPVGKLGT